jgi:hypothetical protein
MLFQSIGIALGGAAIGVPVLAVVGVGVGLVGVGAAIGYVACGAKVGAGIGALIAAI